MYKSKNEKGGKPGTHDDKCNAYSVFIRNLKGTEHFEDLGVEGRITLKVECDGGNWI
jgi:hypothetical protein